MEESLGLLQMIKQKFDCKEQDIRSYSPLSLAYMGDAVYELIVRSVVVERANRSANHLHRMTVRYVKAQTQAKMADALSDSLTQEESEIYRRGRNAKSCSMAKHATVGDYKRATGFEALMGYLYLTGQTDRMLELVRKGIELAGMEI